MSKKDVLGCQTLRGRWGEGGRVDELMGPRAAVYQLRANNHCLQEFPQTAPSGRPLRILLLSVRSRACTRCLDQFPHKLLQVFRPLHVSRTFTVLTLSANSEFYTHAPLARWCPSPSSSDDEISDFRYLFS
jgi:hypothetical protein